MALKFSQGTSQLVKPANVSQQAWDRLTDTGKREAVATGKIPAAEFKRSFYNGQWDDVRDQAIQYKDNELANAAQAVIAAKSKVVQILNRKYTQNTWH